MPVTTNIAQPITFPINVDSKNYEQGQITMSEVIKIGFDSSDIFRNDGPIKTINKTGLRDAGLLVIPRLTAGSKPEVHAIGTPGVGGTAVKDYLKITLDFQLSQDFGGLFTSTGQADQETVDLIDMGLLEIMATSKQEFILNYLIDNGTASTLVKGTDSIADYVIKAKREYSNANNKDAKIMLASPDFVDALESFLGSISVPQGYDVLINGYKGRFKGLEVIESKKLTNADFILYDGNDLNFIYPTNVKQLPPGYKGVAADSLQNELLIIPETTANSGLSKTWVHQFFGLGITYATKVYIFNKV